jgi:predicted RNase H-like HicB family nuclease
LEEREEAIAEAEEAARLGEAAASVKERRKNPGA